MTDKKSKKRIEADKKLIIKLLKDGMDRLSTLDETQINKRYLVLGMIAKAINGKVKTVQNAMYGQMLSQDKSDLLRIYAEKRGIK